MDFKTVNQLIENRLKDIEAKGEIPTELTVTYEEFSILWSELNLQRLNDRRPEPPKFKSGQIIGGGFFSHFAGETYQYDFNDPYYRAQVDAYHARQQMFSKLAKESLQTGLLQYLWHTGVVTLKRGLRCV